MQSSCNTSSDQYNMQLIVCAWIPQNPSLLTITSTTHNVLPLKGMWCEDTLYEPSFGPLTASFSGDWNEVIISIIWLAISTSDGILSDFQKWYKVYTNLTLVLPTLKFSHWFYHQLFLWIRRILGGQRVSQIKCFSSAYSLYLHTVFACVDVMTLMLFMLHHVFGLL